MLAGSEWQDNDLVLCLPNGRPLDPRNDHRAWHELLADAQGRPARLHDARHTAATLLLQQEGWRRESPWRCSATRRSA